MTDPSIEEIRKAIDEEIQLWSVGPEQTSGSTADFVLKTVKRIQEAAAPKPSTPKEAFEKAIKNAGLWPYDERSPQVILRYDDEIYVELSTSEFANRLPDGLALEGYSITHDGVPTQPKLSPVDTGESPKVQLAKQINTLAKLLAEAGQTRTEFWDLMEGFDVSVTAINLPKDDASFFAVALTFMNRRHKEGPQLGQVLSCLHANHVLSTDITQAIDRLNELVAITNESENL